MMNKRILNWLLLLAFVLGGSAGFVSCETDDNHAFDPNDVKKSVVILYENDVHCGIDGYTQMRGLRDAIVRSDTRSARAIFCRATWLVPSRKVGTSSIS